ncbi:MAG: methyltransferase domain-containing protein [Anaerolineales bacterium]|nr:methyltransferase domain-containing protein [Anaerolineales bacterium]
MNEAEILDQRYQIQAEWTRRQRRALLEALKLTAGARLLEVGCGTGVLLRETLADHPGVQLTGLDIDPVALDCAHQKAPPAFSLCTGDAHALPFQEAAFDGVFTHFVFLWLEDPFAALMEIRRVTAPGGWIAAFAEPDYGGRIDIPAHMEPLAHAQTEALKAQGADPFLGRSLRALFAASGLEYVRCGVLGGAWEESYDLLACQSEWDTIRRDLDGIIPPEELDLAEKMDRAAWESGTRILFVPTFYAIGFSPVLSPV